MAAIGNIPPGAISPPGAPPGAPPMAPPGLPKPPMGGGPPVSGLFLLLSFLAGSGVHTLTDSIAKLHKLATGGPTADPTRAHRGGVRLEATQTPSMTIAPQMAQMLAQKAAQQPSGSDELVSLLSKALMMNAGSGGVA